MVDIKVDESEGISIALPTNILAEIDAHVGSQFADRDDFMRTAARYYLEAIRNRSSIENSNKFA